MRLFNATSDWRQRWVLLLEKIRRVQTREDEMHLLARLSRPQQPFVLAFANAHAMNSLAASGAFFAALNSADMVLRDGSGMAALYRLLKMEPGLNLNGTDFIPELIRQFNSRCIGIFGTQNPYLQQGGAVIARTLAPDSRQVIAHGFLDVGDYVALACEYQPGLIVLGMGMPRQEEVAAILRSRLNFPCLIVCGGAIIDFLGGRTQRAPLWVRKAGMEWAFRLALEPRRLFQRYVIGNPLFLTRALRLARHHRVALDSPG
jgi:N-acetylglucosaminyldiphosphoundecaprenol N-acetyl-beta-D-mannosaminyltransferase